MSNRIHTARDEEGIKATLFGPQEKLDKFISPGIEPYASMFRFSDIIPVARLARVPFWPVPDNSIGQCRFMWREATAGEVSELPASPGVSLRGSSGGQLRVDRLARIQAAFGLPLKTLAEVLHVSRAQLYKWFDASRDLSIQDDNAERLAIVEALAQSWLRRSTQPLVAVGQEPVDNGDTIIDLLSRSKIDSAAVERAFDVLAKKLEDRPRTRSQRLRDTGFARRRTHRSLCPDD